MLYDLNSGFQTADINNVDIANTALAINGDNLIYTDVNRMIYIYDTRKKKEIHRYDLSSITGTIDNILIESESFISGFFLFDNHGTIYDYSPCYSQIIDYTSSSLG